MSQRTLLPLLLLLSSLSLISGHLTAYDELNRTGLPAGLLPSNVLSYSLHPTSGDFTLDLDESCRITLPPDNYIAVYNRRITGRMVNGEISGLDGIKVRAFFRWWSITGIKSDGDDVVFDVGVTSAKYGKRNFDVSPDCEGRAGKKADS
ncbi:hypothetical protein LUZ60_000428 [Juncus effusus]|nr:hypothetical protein LUZ60_000428 [Juncus effusus]